MGVLDKLRSDAQEAPIGNLEVHRADAREELAVIDPEGFATLTLRDELACTIGRVLYEGMTVAVGSGNPFARMAGVLDEDEIEFEWISPETVQKLKDGEGRFALGYLIADLAIEMTKPLGELPLLD